MKFIFGAFIFLNSLTVQAEYKKPEAQIDQLVRAPSFSRPVLNWQKTALIKTYMQEMPSIAYVTRPQMKLAGVRFNPQNYTSISNYYIQKIVYFDLKSKTDQLIPFPMNSVLREVLWSPDGKKLAVSVEKENCHEVWLAQIPSLKISKIPGVCLNAILGRTIEWVSSDELLLKIRTPSQNKEVVALTSAPTGPVILESNGQVAQNRTYPDLLKTTQDEKTFATAVKSQLSVFNLKKSQLTKIGSEDLYSTAQFSPDKKLILVRKLLAPFSFIVPVNLFASKTEIWTPNGKLLSLVDRSEKSENIPIQGVKTGPRSFEWASNSPQTLIFAEALDKGDWAVKTDYRDEVFKINFGPQGEIKKTSLFKLKNRYSGIAYIDEDNSYLIYDYERDKQWLTGYLVNFDPNKSMTASKIIISVNTDDDYKSPGEPVEIRNKWGRHVIATQFGNENSRFIFMSGNGATPEGEKPFLRRWDISAKVLDSLNEKNIEVPQTEIFRSQKGSYESFLTFMDSSFKTFLTSFESSTQSPQIKIREASGNEQTAKLLYADANPYEILSQLKKEIITYKRTDGVLLSGVLYYPLNYEAGKKYPAIVHAYPLEYTDASMAGQVRGSSDRFSKPFREAVIYHALRGYFVLDEAQMPIIGHPETKNDTFIEQLVAGAKAAVDTLVDKGFIDRERVGVMGHSYGAFMVSHLLTHSDLFAAGVAKSGAYNRTLTPFGFQGERRPFWKAKDVYLKMSPFMDVDKMKKAMLLIHGQADDNPGTFTLQSERYFDALKGQGATARLVLFPGESHGYAAIESVETVLAEMFEWFDRYVKNAEVKLKK